jgi:hypothetical protein
MTALSFIKKPIKRLRSQWTRLQAQGFVRKTFVEKPDAHGGLVAFNSLPVMSAWGGGNQWLVQMIRYLGSHGYEVVFDLERPGVDCIVVLHSSSRLGGTFGYQDIRKYRQDNPGVRVLHRINENDARKGTDFMDDDIAQMNDVADHTVFISDWLRRHHAKKWFRNDKPHSVIWNGANSKYFNHTGSTAWRKGQGNLILVTHHWADHWNKGFKVYQQVDEAINRGLLPNVELWIIGRWPKEIAWKTATTFPPCSGQALANRLKQAHVYITGSLAEPGGMHFIEGLQCGLPLLYHTEGGGIVEVGQSVNGIAFTDDPISAILEIEERYEAIREHVLKASLSGDHMVSEYGRIIHELVSGSGEAR